jgi:TPR repeat protein
MDLTIKKMETKYNLLFDKNYEEAKKYYLMAIEQGNPHAMYNLAKYYATTEKDYKEAKKYYLMAIEQGNSDAMYNLENTQDILVLYKLLKSIENPNDMILTKIKKLEKSEHV